MLIEKSAPVIRLAAGLLVALTFAGPAAAAGFASFNQGFLARATALPVLGEGQVLGPGAREYRVTLDLTNEFHDYPLAGREQILLDGETQRWALTWRWGLANGLELSAELPLLHEGGGFLDGFIEDWHRWFGLPNGGREMRAHDAYRFRYVRDGRVMFDRSEGGTGLGDSRLALGWQAAPGLVLRGMAQLPTADSQFGSFGNGGGAVWADATFGTGWSGFASGGVSINSGGALLADQQKDVVPFAGLGAFVPVLGRLEVGAQLYAHGPLYEDSELDALKRVGVQLAFGGRYPISEHLRLDLALQEDLVTRSSPDFSVHVGLSIR